MSDEIDRLTATLADEYVLPPDLDAIADAMSAGPAPTRRKPNPLAAEVARLTAECDALTALLRGAAIDLRAVDDRLAALVTAGEAMAKTLNELEHAMLWGEHDTVTAWRAALEDA